MSSSRKPVLPIYAVIGVAVASLGFGVWDSCFAMADGQNVTTVTDKNNGEEILLAKGTTLVVKLEATPGTGHGWRVVKTNLDLLKPLGEPRFESSREGMPGAVEHQVFSFKAEASGSTVLELHYLRPWERDVPPLRTYRISLRIR